MKKSLLAILLAVVTIFTMSITVLAYDIEDVWIEIRDGVNIGQNYYGKNYDGDPVCLDPEDIFEIDGASWTELYDNGDVTIFWYDENDVMISDLYNSIEGPTDIGWYSVEVSTFYNDYEYWETWAFERFEIRDEAGNHQHNYITEPLDSAIAGHFTHCAGCESVLIDEAPHFFNAYLCDEGGFSTFYRYECSACGYQQDVTGKKVPGENIRYYIPPTWMSSPIADTFAATGTDASGIDISVREIPVNFSNNTSGYVSNIVDAINSNAVASAPVSGSDVLISFEINVTNNGEAYTLKNGETVEAYISIGDYIDGFSDGTLQIVNVDGFSAHAVVPKSVDDWSGMVSFNITSSGTYVLIKSPGEGRYARRQLAGMPNGDSLVKVYDALVNASAAFIPSFNIPADVHITPDALGVILSAYACDYPEHFWFDRLSYSSNKITNEILAIAPQYIDSLATQTAVDDFNDACVELLEDIGITPLTIPHMSQEEMALFIHGAIIDHVDYVDAQNAHNAYGAIIDGLAVCEGYCELYQHLLSMVGIEAIRVEGYSKGEAHAWNIVNIDGQYYHTDVTWDDQGEGKEGKYYVYFCVPTAVITEDHMISTPFALPECTSYNANPFYSICSFMRVNESTIFDSIVNQIKGGDSFARIFIEDGTDFLSWFSVNASDLISEIGFTGPVSLNLQYLKNEYHVFLSAQLTVSYFAPEGCIIEEADGTPADENGQFSLLSGNPFRFRVVPQNGYYIDYGDYSVTVNGERIWANEFEIYETEPLMNDAVIVVEGIYPQTDMSTLGISFVIGNNKPATVGDVVAITSISDGIEIYDSNVLWQWFVDNDPVTEADFYEDYEVKESDLGHEIKLRALGAPDGKYTGFVDSGWIPVVELEEPEINITVKPAITYDLQAVVASTVDNWQTDILYSTNSNGAVTVEWFADTNGVFNEANILTGAPKNAGSYFVRISVAADGAYTSGIKIAAFEIRPMAGGAPINPVLNSKGAESLTINVAARSGVKQLYLIRPVSSPAYTMYDDDERGWLTSAGSTVTFENLKPYTTYRVFTYWPGDGMNFGATNVSYVDFTTLPASIEIPAECTDDFIYNGLEQTYVVEENEAYTVSGNIKANAGEYDVIISLVDKIHTQWTDGSTEDLVYRFVINQKVVTIDMVTVEGEGSLACTGSPVHPAVTIMDGEYQLVEDVDYVLYYHISSADGATGSPDCDKVGDYAVDIESPEDSNYIIHLTEDEYPQLRYILLKAVYDGDPVTATLTVPVDSEIDTSFSFASLVYNNLPEGLVINYCIVENTYEEGLWTAFADEIRVLGDITGLAGTTIDLNVLIASDVYDDIYATVTVSFTEPAPEPAGELTLKEDTGLTLGAVDGLGTCLEGLKPATSVDAVKAYFENSENVKVYKADGVTEITGGAYVGTGCIIRLMNGDEVLSEAKVILMGDLNGDGQITSTDALMALKISSGLDEAEDIYVYAGNLNHDTKISSAEALQILKYSSGLIDTLS